jgi:hypothetical protein
MFIRVLVVLIYLACMGIAIAAETSTFSGRVALGFEGALFNPAGTSELWRIDGKPDLLTNLWANEYVGEAPCKNIVVTAKSINTSSNKIAEKKLYIEEIINIAPLTDCEFTNGYEISTPNSPAVNFFIEKYREGPLVFVATRHEYRGDPPDTNYSSWVYDCEDGTYRIISAAYTAEEMRTKPSREGRMQIFKEGTSGYDVGLAACQ